MSNLVLIEQAARSSGYDKNYIRYLVREGFIQGEKIGGIWLVDPDSLKAYEERMKEEGSGKHTPTRYRKT